jgi:hypothetical protein
VLAVRSGSITNLMYAAILWCPLCARYMLLGSDRVCNVVESCRLTFHKDLANQVRLSSCYKDGQNRVTTAWGRLIKRVLGFLAPPADYAADGAVPLLRPSWQHGAGSIPALARGQP